VTPPPRLHVWLALAGGAVSGALLAVQSKVNSDLGQRLGDAPLAAVVSFASGLAVLLVVAAAVRPLRTALHRLRTAGLPAWTFIGGFIGGLFVLLAALVVPSIGVALFSIGMITGQSAGALVADRFGLGPAGRHAFTVPRVIGTVIAVLSVGLAQFGGVRAALPAAAVSALLVLVVLAGAGTSVQSALNGVVGRSAGVPLAATLINFAVGTVTLVLLFAVLVVVRGLHVSGWPGEPWLYVGGVLGIVFVSVNVVAVRVLGVLRTALVIVAGQLIAAVALDVLSGVALSGWLLAGAALTVAGVVVSNLPAGIPSRSWTPRHDHGETAARAADLPEL
jgi:transporter family-2 protein